LKEISLHILDIAENSVNAGASTIKIIINENINKNKLVIEIIDNGKGMDTDTVKRITDPFVTTRTTRKVGLGIPFLKAAAEACQGNFQINSELGKGTRVFVSFQHDHIDRMPLGDIENTLLSLIVGYPNTRWIFIYQIDERVFEFDTKPVKEILGDVPFSDPAVISYLKKVISEGINNINNK